MVILEWLLISFLVLTFIKEMWSLISCGPHPINLQEKKEKEKEKEWDETDTWRWMYREKGKKIIIIEVDKLKAT